MKKLLVSLMAVFAIANISVAQEAAIKWNPLYLGLGSVNLGIEFSVAPKWTLAFEGNAVIFNPWQNGDNSIYANGWTGTFEARWYTCEAFNGHHLGLYGTVGRFGEASSNFDLFNKIALGGHGATGATNVKAAMLGLSYGYYLKLNHGWGLDFYVGGGILYAMYNTPGSTDRRAISNLRSPVWASFFPTNSKRLHDFMIEGCPSGQPSFFVEYGLRKAVLSGWGQSRHLVSGGASLSVCC